jgi:NADH-quinone oxidoreductase subunit L
VLGVWGAWVIYVELGTGAEWPSEAPETRKMLEHKYWVDEIYDAVLVRPAERIAAGLRVFDRVFVDGVSYAVGLVPSLAGYALRTFQSGYLQSYGLYMIGGLGLVGILALRGLAAR